MTANRDTPGVIAPPPLIYLGFLLTGWAVGSHKLPFRATEFKAQAQLAMVRAAMEGNYDKARKLHYKHLEMIHAIFVDGNPAGVKGLLSVMNICSEYLRLPLVNVGKATLNKFEGMLAG